VILTGSFSQQVTRWAAALAAVIFMLNAVAAGGAVAATTADSLGAICATSTDGAGPQDKSIPSQNAHKHGLCCFLHHGSLSTVSIARILVLIDFPAQKIFDPHSEERTFALQDPGRSPQSPRAPPSNIA
jgi:hypothetical protein